MSEPSPTVNHWLCICGEDVLSTGGMLVGFKCVQCGEAFTCHDGCARGIHESGVICADCKPRKKTARQGNLFARKGAP